MTSMHLIYSIVEIHFINKIIKYDNRYERQKLYRFVATLTLSVPHFLWLLQKWVYQSVQRHTGLTHPF